MKKHIHLFFFKLISTKLLVDLTKYLIWMQESNDDNDKVDPAGGGKSKRRKKKKRPEEDGSAAEVTITFQ